MELAEKLLGLGDALVREEAHGHVLGCHVVVYIFTTLHGVHPRSLLNRHAKFMHLVVVPLRRRHERVRVQNLL